MCTLGPQEFKSLLVLGSPEGVYRCVYAVWRSLKYVYERIRCVRSLKYVYERICYIYVMLTEVCVRAYMLCYAHWSMCASVYAVLYTLCCDHWSMYVYEPICCVMITEVCVRVYLLCYDHRAVYERICCVTLTEVCVRAYSTRNVNSKGVGRKGLCSIHSNDFI